MKAKILKVANRMYKTNVIQKSAMVRGAHRSPKGNMFVEKTNH